MTKTVALPAVAGAALFAVLGALGSWSDLAVGRLALGGAGLVAAAFIDARERRVPNRIVIPTAAACALLAGPTTLRESLPALILVGGMLGLALARPDALGMGDIKHAALVALALGAVATLALVLGLALAAAAGCLIVATRGRHSLAMAIPLAPFFATGAAVALAIG